jgi:type VI secretion system protein
MQRALKNTIQQYEPRLKNAQVRHIKNDDASELTLQFEITGQLYLPDGRRQALRFATAVDSSGNVRIS